jgi:hypothetical protein
LFRIGSEEDVTLIAIYVDDILVASRDLKRISEIRRMLADQFEIKDLGDVKHCLGVEFSQVDGQVTMHQRGYVADVLERFGMSECKPIGTPVDLGTKLKTNGEQTEEDLKLPYRELVGALTYLATTTRPDISFAVSCLGQFNNCYTEEHWKAAKRVLRYLKGTMGMGLTYGSNAEPIKGFVDADWGSCPENRRSYTGFVFLVNGGPVSWDSKKQKTVALSTTEAEYGSIGVCERGHLPATFLARITPGTHLLHATRYHATLRYATEMCADINKDLNTMRTHLFHAIRQHATRRGTTYARSNRPDFLVSVLKRVVPPPRSRDFHTGSQVLPPDRKHPLLIDLKFSKNSGMIVHPCRILMKQVNISF